MSLNPPLPTPVRHGCGYQEERRITTAEVSIVVARQVAP